MEAAQNHCTAYICVLVWGFRRSNSLAKAASIQHPSSHGLQILLQAEELNSPIPSETENQEFQIKAPKSEYINQLSTKQKLKNEDPSLPAFWGD